MKRHVLDFGEFSTEESTSFGLLVNRTYSALRHESGAERIYQASMMEGTPHFHAWIIPRARNVPERGIHFLAKDLTCSEQEATRLAAALRLALNPP